MKEKTGVKGTLRFIVEVPDPDAIHVQGCEWDNAAWEKDAQTGLWSNASGRRDNAFVNQGLQYMLRRYFSVSGDTPPAAPSHIAVSNGTSAVTASTTAIDGTSISYSPFDSGYPQLTNQTVSSRATFTKGSGSAQINFAVSKLGLCVSNVASGIQDIIGGTGGSSPYNEPLSIDLTGAASFNFIPQIDVSLTAV